MSKKKKNKKKKPLAPRLNEHRLIERLASKVRRGEITLPEAVKQLKAAPKAGDGSGVGMVSPNAGRRVGDSQAVYRKHGSFRKRP